MASGTRLGNIYVEVSLDDKVYKQKLASMPSDAQATTKGLEASWKSLGVKTNQYFDDQRKAAENAYKLIEKSGKFSADELARAEKAKNDKINQYNEQQFGKTEGLLTKLKNNWVVAAASITAAYMAAQKAWNIAEQAAKYEQSAVAFHTMATSMGKDATTEFNKIKEASKGLIDDASLTTSINKALSLGIPLESIADLMEIAQAKSRDMGTTTQQAFSDIATGVGRASPLILDNLGLVMKVGSANDELAKKLGKSTAELTDQEKKTAILNATLEAGKEAVARYNLEQLTTAERMQALQTTVTNLQLMLGQGIIRAAAGAVGAFQSIEAASVTVSAGIWKIIETYYKFRAAFSWGDVSKEFTEQANAARANAEADMKAASGYWKSAKNNFDSMTATTADMAKAMGGVAPIAKKVGDTTVSAANNSKKAIENVAKAHSAAVEKAIKDEESYRKKVDDVNDELESGTRETYNQIYNIQQDEHTKGLKLISEQRDKYEALGADKEKIAKWTKAQIEKLEKDLNDKTIKYWQGQEDEWVATMKAETDAAAAANTKQIQYIEKFEDAINDAQDELEYTAKTSIPNVVKANSTLWDDMKTGWKNAENQCGTFATNAGNVFSTFVTSASNAVSDTLYDAIKTGTVSMGDIWDTFCDSMLKAFTDAVGNMVVKAAMNTIKMVFDAAWNAGASVVIGAIGKLLNYFFDAGFAYGGPVKGYASGGDSPAFDTVPALLSPGEYVMPRSAVNSQTIPHLEYMRQNKRPRGFAGGGYVDEDSPYADVYKYAGMEYRDGSWNAFKITGWDEALEEWIKTYTPISDPISYAGEYLNKTFGYGLQDEAGGTVGQDDYEYLIKWWGSTIAGIESMFGYGEGFDDRMFDQFRVSPLTGSKNPNVVWVEPEDNGYRWYMRDGSNYWTDPSESNWAKRFMPTIIKGISAVMAAWMGAVAGAFIGAGGAVGTATVGGDALSSGLAAGYGSMASSIGSAIGAGTIGGFMSYGENGSVTAALIAALIAGAAGYAGASSGIFDWSRGNIISSVIRLGAKAVLKQLAGDTFSISPPNVSMESVDDGGLLDTIIANLKDIAPKTSYAELSFRNGLDYVPYDNFPARLHEGERVLTKEENRASGKAPVFHIYLDGEEIKGRMRIIADKVFVDRASSGIGSMQRVYA